MLLNDPCLMQGSVEWKELRKTKITSSDAAICMGLNPYPEKDIVSLYEEKMGLRPEFTPNFFQKQAMNRGTKYEEAARSYFERNAGVLLFPKVVISDWQMTSLDGIDLDETLMLEIKVGGKKLHDLAKKGKIPVYYRCQMMHHLCLMPHLRECHYLSYQPAILDEDGEEVTPEEGVALIVERDDAFIEELVEAEWYLYDCMQTKTPPKLNVRV